MEVKLISYSQPVNSDGDKNPLSIAELAASVCYDSEPTDTYRIVKGCKATGHRSVLEHISFTFEVSGVSRALLAQLSRHRHISLSVQSQRYVSMDNLSCDYYSSDAGNGSRTCGFCAGLSRLPRYSHRIYENPRPEVA